MNLSAFFTGIIGLIFGAGCFYALTNWRLKACEDSIKIINENHLVHIKNDILKIRLTLAKITQKMDIEDEPIESKE